jgi:hypothetical protein
MFKKKIDDDGLHCTNLFYKGGHIGLQWAEKFLD